MVRLFCGFRYSTQQDVYFNVPANLIGESLSDEKSGATVLRIPETMLIDFDDQKTTCINDLRKHFKVTKKSTDEFDFLLREIQENYISNFGRYELSGYGVMEHIVVVLVEGKDGRLERPRSVEDAIEKFREIVESMDLQGKFGFYCYEK